MISLTINYSLFSFQAHLNGCTTIVSWRIGCLHWYWVWENKFGENDESGRCCETEFVRSMINASDWVDCWCSQGATLSFLCNFLSTISAAVSRRDPPLPNVHPRRLLISSGSWILAIFCSSLVSTCIRRSISWSIQAWTASEASLNWLLNSKSFSSRLSTWVFLTASLIVDRTCSV